DRGSHFSSPSTAMSHFPVSTVAIGGDHAGYSMKCLLTEYLRGSEMMVVDCGTDSEAPCDFPDLAERVSMEVLQGSVQRGILVCGSGVGVAVAANKIPGIRAGICHDTYSAHQGVEHDDMNVLCIGARVIGPELAMEIIRAFLAARYVPEERHARRLEQVLQMERNGLGSTV